MRFAVLPCACLRQTGPRTQIGALPGGVPYRRGR